MTPELRRAMQGQVGSSTAPSVGDVWRAGRRRRSSRRWLAGAGAVTAVLLVVGVATQVVTDDGSQTVRAGVAEASCRPRTYLTEQIFGSNGSYDPQEPPKTAAAMVRGGGSEHLRKPEVVARVKVLSIDERPTPTVSLPNVNPSGLASKPEVRAWVEVTDPVFGADIGDRFTISDAGSAALLAELGAAKKIVMQQIDDFQNHIDELSRPLEALDEQIIATPADDPAYQELVGRRADVKEQVDAARQEALDQLHDYQQRLQILQVSERLTALAPVGTSCHRFREGDDLVVALVRPAGGGTFELTGPSSFFLVDGNGFSEELDAARRSVPGWSDSELLRLARESTPDEFVDHLRDAVDD
jgi:hypothetical protein